MLVIVGYGTSSSGVIGHWFTGKEGAEIVWSTVRMAEPAASATARQLSTIPEGGNHLIRML